LLFNGEWYQVWLGVQYLREGLGSYEKYFSLVICKHDRGGRGIEMLNIASIELKKNKNKNGAICWARTSNQK